MLSRLFDIGDAEPAARASGGRPLTCVSCGLYRHAQAPKMAPHGDNRASLMIVGDAPGDADDRLGRHWQGKEGRLLRDVLGDVGMDLDRDCVSVNAVNCRPPGNRPPSPYELACCRVKIVQPVIGDRQPRVILLLGGLATSSVVGALYPDADERITKWRGMAIPAPEWGSWICPTFHPGYVLKEDRRREIRTVWEQDIERAVRRLRDPVPKLDNLRDRVTILKTEAEVVAALCEVRSHGTPVSFDYETSGLRALLHKLVCASFSRSEDRAYAFMFGESEKIRDAWREFLEDDSVDKISHNLKFEAEWSCVHFGVERINWKHDSMQAAHVIDNRPGICGLKHQCFIIFGIRPWDDAISPYLSSVDSKNPAALNRIWEFIEKFGEDECLIYCGIDSLTAFRLATRQMEDIARA